MKTKLSPFEWTILGTMGVVLVVGSIGTFILFGKVQEKKAELESHTNAMSMISGRIHYPSAYNMNLLKENSKSIEGFLISLKSVLLPSENRLAEVKELESVEFKDQLSKTVDDLRALAKAKPVAIPAEFYFGFSKYQKQNPRKKDTLVLSKQLLGIEKLVSLLIACGPQKIESIARSFEEHEDIKKGGALEPEQLKFRSIEHPEGFYTTYPLEVEFIGVPANLQQFLNEMGKLPYLYVVRSCYITSLKPVPSRLDELQRQYTATPGQAAGSKAPPLVPVLGEEKIKFKVRVDLIEWRGVSEVAHEKGKKS